MSLPESMSRVVIVGNRSRLDEVIEAMGEVGRHMPVEYRETALGGLANTPTGRAVKDSMRRL